MSHIGFLVLYAAGHVNPSVVLARALQDKGHEVVFFNIADVAPEVTSAGLQFRSFAVAEYPVGNLQELLQKIGELDGAAAVTFFVERMLKLGRTSFQYLPKLISKEKLDLLVIDQFYPGGATLADHLNLPYVSLANALVANREDVIPPPTQLWPYDTSVEAIQRNRKGWEAIFQAFNPLLTVINEQRRVWGLPDYVDLLEDSFSPLAQIAQQPAIFEFPRLTAPDTLHFVGHFKNERHENLIDFDWDRLDGHPLVYASLGTLQNRQDWIFRAIIEACAPLDAQTVIALGKTGYPPEFFGAVPKNIILVPYAPQFELLRNARLCITHGGLNTTLDCLANGVPMVALPIASEQPGIAIRIEYLGAGKVLPIANLDPALLHSTIQTVLSDPSYVQAAKSAAHEIGKLKPIPDAVRIVEEILASRQS